MQSTCILTAHEREENSTMANKWKSISSVRAGLTPDTMLLLTDGTVLVHNTFQ
jgi:hypothetical protein